LSQFIEKLRDLGQVILDKADKILELRHDRDTAPGDQPDQDQRKKQVHDQYGSAPANAHILIEQFSQRLEEIGDQERGQQRSDEILKAHHQ